MRCKWCSISLFVYVRVHAYICDVQTLSFETNYNYLFCITKYTNRPTRSPDNKMCAQSASYDDTDLVVDSNRTEPNRALVYYERQASSGSTPYHRYIFTRWRYHYKLHGINIHLPIYSMSCGTNTTIHVLLLLMLLPLPLLLLQPLHRLSIVRPIRKTGVEIEKSSLFADTNLHWQRMNFSQCVRVLCTLFASHLYLALDAYQS